LFVIYSDGGSRGNPGISAFAVVVTQDGRMIEEYSEFLGVHTNNYAEYRGLIYAIGRALHHKAEDVEFVMDSELVIKQMRGEYKVKSPDMKSLNEDAKALSSLIRNVRFTHVRRENPMISRADHLLNLEMDRHQRC